MAISNSKTKSTKQNNQNPENEREWDLRKGESFVPSGNKVPCDLRDPAYVPYWEKKNGEIIYGIDEYEVIAICGWNDCWFCRLIDKDKVESGAIEPNIDVFFTIKDAEKKINALKKTEDPKKLAKWERKEIFEIGRK